MTAGEGAGGGTSGPVYDLVDVEGGEVVGAVTADGVVVAGDPLVGERVRAAFARELLVREGALVEELGVCFAGVETLRPGEPGHARAVLTHLGVLAGVAARPRAMAG